MFEVRRTVAGRCDIDQLRSTIVARYRIALLLLAVALAVALPPEVAAEQDKAAEESWEVLPEFARHQPTVIAVMPMDNLSLEPEVDRLLQEQIQARLSERGYARVSAEHMQRTMRQLGVTVPGLLAGFSPARLADALHADALMFGQIDQSAAIHQGVYDAVVVSCSLKLVEGSSGRVLWHAEQWRSAHRQLAIDPFNMLINLLQHAGDSREDRIGYLVGAMLKTLPAGPVTVGRDKLLDEAVELADPR
jgi:hypothetical protein